MINKHFAKRVMQKPDYVTSEGSDIAHLGICYSRVQRDVGLVKFLGRTEEATVPRGLSSPVGKQIFVLWCDARSVRDTDTLYEELPQGHRLCKRCVTSALSALRYMIDMSSIQHHMIQQLAAEGLTLEHFGYQVRRFLVISIDRENPGAIVFRFKVYGIIRTLSLLFIDLSTWKRVSPLIDSLGPDDPSDLYLATVSDWSIIAQDLSCQVIQWLEKDHPTAVAAFQGSLEDVLFQG